MQGASTQHLFHLLRAPGKGQGLTVVERQFERLRRVHQHAALRRMRETVEIRLLQRRARNPPLVPALHAMRVPASGPNVSLLSFRSYVPVKRLQPEKPLARRRPLSVEKSSVSGYGAFALIRNGARAAIRIRPARKFPLRVVEQLRGGGIVRISVNGATVSGCFGMAQPATSAAAATVAAQDEKRDEARKARTRKNCRGIEGPEVA